MTFDLASVRTVITIVCRELKIKLISQGQGAWLKKVAHTRITERRVPQLIPVLGSQPAGDVSHKPGGRLPLLSARPAVTPTTLERAATYLLLGEQRQNRCEQFA